MKKRFFAGLAVFAVIGAAAAVILCHSTGWYAGDPLEYVKSNCHPDGKTILDGKYLATGEDEQGGFIIYRVTTEVGSEHCVRIHVTFERTLTQIGLRYRIRGVSELDYFEEREIPG